ncbi:4'-phosphopantetheinyl transferase family protein [Verminephrobacter eiseniae]|uniref:4'-phosphopantetheinyl transferase family protein n=1 Tax=Verminephrobacter eiseniae TaxID=364317 RepID=UPI002238C9D7|nr:hypothetical protein [Verminephrobacter eiseniae]
MSLAELVRAANIARADKRSEFIAARRALRWFLAQQKGDEPSHVEFNHVSGPLQPVGHYRDLTCSLAHRHGRIALAISATGPIGIDMEHVIPHRAGSLSSDLLHGLPVDMIQIKPVQLFAAWCELEALSKMQQVDLPVLLPQWRQLCQVAGLPTVMPKERYITDIRLSHWKPFPSWRLVLASKDLVFINIRVDA